MRINVTGSGNADGYIDVSVNGVTVTASLYMRKNAGTVGSTGTIAGTLTVGSITQNVSRYGSWAVGTYYLVGTVTGTINGTGNVSTSVSNSGTALAGTYTGSGTVTTITAPAISSLTLKSKTVNSITCSFKVNKADTFYYKLSTQNSWQRGNNNVTNGEFTIDGLEPNKQYTINFLARNWISENAGTCQDSTKDIKITTYDIARIINYPKSFNINEPITIKFNKQADYRTKLIFYKQNPTQEIYRTDFISGTEYTWNYEADDLYELIPNSNSMNLYIVLNTYPLDSDTSYGNDFREDIIAKVINSNPTFSDFSYEDTNTEITALTGNNQILINGYSNVKITIATTNKAIAKNKATIKNYKAIIGSQSKETDYSSTEDITMQIDKVTSGIIAVNAIDTRENSTQVLKIAEIKDYSKPVITRMELIRSNNGVGENVTLNFEGTWWNNSFGEVQNAISKIEYWYKKTDYSSDFVKGTKVITFNVSENKFSGSLIIEGDTADKGFDASSSYYIYMNVTDKLDVSNDHQETLGSGKPAIAIYKDNIAIGQKYDTEKGGKVQADGDIIAKNFIGTVENNIDTVKHTNYPNEQNHLPTFGFLSFWNGAYNEDNNSNLKYCAGGEIQAIPKVLYDDNDGTSETVTLNETAANFSILEIFYYLYSNSGSQYNLYRSVKIADPNEKYFSLDLLRPTSANILQMFAKRYSISGTTITKVSNEPAYNFGFHTNGTIAQAGSDEGTLLRIYKVIGYK